VESAGAYQDDADRRELALECPHGILYAAPAGGVMSASLRLEALTTLRFFAAFAVVLAHSHPFFPSPRFLDNLPLASAVSFFFVLSGFILTYVYPQLPTRREVARFYVMRLARIWPVHICALILSIALFGWITIFGWGTPKLAIVPNILLVHAWLPFKELFFSFNAVSWSLSVELCFYLLFPVLIHRFASNWPVKLLGAALPVVGAMVVCSVLNRFPPYDPKDLEFLKYGILYINPISRLFEFVLGMCAALLWRNLGSRFGSNLAAWTIAEIAIMLQWSSTLPLRAAPSSILFYTWHRQLRGSCMPTWRHCSWC
jgi:peptidoglycan/LPS O-acetylase OafA/YrhL